MICCLFCWYLLGENFTDVKFLVWISQFYHICFKVCVVKTWHIVDCSLSSSALFLEKNYYEEIITGSLIIMELFRLWKHCHNVILSYCRIVLGYKNIYNNRAIQKYLTWIIMVWGVLSVECFKNGERKSKIDTYGGWAVLAASASLIISKAKIVSLVARVIYKKWLFDGQVRWLKVCRIERESATMDEYS